MNVFVLGAAGKTGHLIVERAVAVGHEVTALVRDASRYDAPPGVRALLGDATDPVTLAHAMVGQDAVIDAIGGKTPWRKTDLERTVARALVAAARRHGTRRIIAISSLGVGDSTAHAPLLLRLLLLPTFLRGSTADKAAMEREVEQAGIPVCPGASRRVERPTRRRCGARAHRHREGSTDHPRRRGLVRHRTPHHGHSSEPGGHDCQPLTGMRNTADA